MPTREELFAAYAVADRERTRVRMNFVESADGAVTLGGRSGALGGPTDRALMQVLRALADGVLVGDEDAAWRRDQGLGDQPVLAIVSGALRLEPTDDVFAKAVTPPTVVTTDAAARARGAFLAPVADVMECGEGAVDFSAMLERFAARGWTQVLCEGGPHLFGSLLEAGVVDEVCVTVAPRFVGGAAGRIVQGASEADRRFALAGVVTDDEGFAFLRYTAL